MEASRVSTRTLCPIPAAAGIGLRPEHYDAVLDTPPRVAWFEVHSENYMGDGGRPVRVLEAVRARAPISFHGVGLSLGSVDPLDTPHLARLRALAHRFEPGLVSEHLAWTSLGGVHFNDLLPLPCTREALRHVARRVERVQDALGRTIAVENPSTYVRFDDEEMDEATFLVALARQTGCSLLADLNNVYVSACNHGRDPYRWLEAIPPELVTEIHLAGHTRRSTGDGEVLIDTHSAPVSDAVWALYDRALSLWGPRPTLIEWDRDLPPLETLVGEARTAQARLEAVHAVAG